MKSVLAKIFSRTSDEEVHSEFIRFGKGLYENRYVTEARKQKSAYSVKTSAEFTNFLVRACLEEASSEIAVKGVIIATFDVHTDALRLLGNGPLAGVKRYLGIKQLQIEGKVDPKKLLALMDAYPRAFYALSFSTPSSVLKIKPKAPKSGKPATAGEKEVTANFCSLKTSNQELVKELFFDVPDFQEVKVRHTLTISDILLPAGISDPVQLREQAKRKGTLTRIVVVDGKESKREIEFEA